MIYITFDSHYYALKAQKDLGENFSLCPTPRMISSSCSSCLKCSDEVAKPYMEDLDKIISLFGLDGVYKIENKVKKIIYERK